MKALLNHVILMSALQKNVLPVSSTNQNMDTQEMCNKVKENMCGLLKSICFIYKYFVQVLNVVNPAPDYSSSIGI